MLKIRFSGGMGVSYEGYVELSALPDALLKRVNHLLSEYKQSDGKNTIELNSATGLMEYEFRYSDSNTVIKVSDGDASDEMIAMIDALSDYISYDSKLTSTSDSSSDSEKPEQ